MCVCVAQSVEQATLNRLVAGSNPVTGTKKYYASVAQLVERLPCKQRVAGSIPVGSFYKEKKTMRLLRLRLLRLLNLYKNAPVVKLVNTTDLSSAASA